MDITGVDPDIWYRVDITVVGVPLSTYFIHDVNFNFTMGDCIGTNTTVVYEFQVTPTNGAGIGKTRPPVTGYFIGRKC